MSPSTQAILKDYDFDPSRLERVSHRRHPQALEIVAPDPAWPQHFAVLKDKIQTALGPIALAITHVGSTSIPNMPAKAVIDIDLTVSAITDEASYVPALEAAGFQFLVREPRWHEHRLFCAYEPEANLHVWAPGSPEVERHLVFRQWLLEREDERALYERTKRAAMEESARAGEDTMQYNKRKEDCIRGILRRAFRELGYIKEE